MGCYLLLASSDTRVIQGLRLKPATLRSFTIFNIVFFQNARAVLTV